MRIEKVIIQNINSLYGTQTVDFNDEAYRTSNLFLLWGDTGSGKSTVLDAITLAMYGKTPRFSGKNDFTNDKNPVMSQGAKTCRAEVIFSLENVRYSASYTQSQKKNGNGLDKYKQELAILNDDGTCGQIIASNSDRDNPFDQKILQLTQLTFDQFTQTVLLAQGGFEQFLNAKTADRTDILQKLTKTEIYSELSKQAYKKSEDAEKELDIAKAALKGISLLGAEDIEKIHVEQAAYEKEIAQLKTELTTLESHIAWKNKVLEQQKQLDEVHAQNDALQADIAAFAPQKHRLEDAVKASGVIAAYDAYITAQTRYRNEETALHSLKQKEPDTVQNEQQARSAEKMCSNAFEQAKTALENAKPLFDDMRKLNTELAVLKRNLVNSESKAREAKTAHEEAENAVKTNQDKINAITDRLKNGEIYFKEHAADENLSRDLEAIKMRAENVENTEQALQKAAAEAQKASSARANAEKSLKTAQKKLQENEEAFAALETGAQNAGKQLECALGGHDKSDLEKRLQDQKDLKQQAAIIASFEETRKTLKDGECCPLCGATSHPFCTETPQASKYDAEIKALTQQLDAIRIAENNYNSAENARRNAEIDLEKLRAALRVMENERAQCIQTEEEKCEAHKAAAERLNCELNAFNQMTSAYSASQPCNHSYECNELIAKLSKAEDVWRKSKTAFEQLKNELAQNQNALSAAQAKCDASRNALAQAEREKAQAQKDVDEKSEEIRAKYGDKDVDAEENTLTANQKDTENRLKDARKTREIATNELTKLQADIASCEKNIEACLEEQTQKNDAFVSALNAQGIANEAEFTAMRLDKPTLEKLQKQARDLDDCATRIHALEQKAQSALEETLALAMTDRELGDLQTEKDTKHARMNECYTQTGINQDKLANQQKNAGEAAKQQAEVDKKQAEFDRWNKLNKLIGSSNGNKFSQFAQGITFNILLNRANHFMQDRKLLPRYMLVRDDKGDQSLEFNVHDFQTGSMRSARGMSGGEKFCLCLALALGLSEMARQNAEIDSLFIDEGLGTLDDATLDIALAMLQSLGNDKTSRTIGLISHIARAREAISTHITVEKLGNGRSRLSGPGCSLKLDTAPKEAPKEAPKKRGRKPKASS